MLALKMLRCVGSCQSSRVSEYFGFRQRAYSFTNVCTAPCVTTVSRNAHMIRAIYCCIEINRATTSIVASKDMPKVTNVCKA